MSAVQHTPKPLPVPASAMVERAGLARAVAVAARFAERTDIIPILTSVLIRGSADGTHLLFTATNLDREVTVAVPGAVDPDFVAAVPAHKLSEIIKRAKACEMVALDVRPGDATDEYKLAADFGGLSITMAGMDPADFPFLPATVDGHRWSIPSATLAKMIGKTEHAQSTEETRYYLNGTFLHPAETPDGPVLRAVAMDGHRLASYQVPIPLGAADMPGVIVPSGTIGEIARLLKGSERVAVDVSESFIRFKIDADVTVTSKLVDGSFPDYGRVIPQSNDQTFAVRKADLAEAVKQVSAILEARWSRALKIEPLADRIRLSIHNPDLGTATADVSAMYGQDDPPCEFGVNNRYLLAALDTVDGDDVRIRLRDPGSPMLIESDDDPALVYVLMPMRV